MAAIYGTPKRMKTSMVLGACPNALWVAGEGANAIHSVATNEYGFEPIIYEAPIRTLPDLHQLLQAAANDGWAESYPELAVDGLTAICDASIQMWKDNPKLTDKGKVDNFYPYQQLKDYLLRIANDARHIGMSVYYVTHEQVPSTREGVFTPGGPSLGSKQQVTYVPAWCDLNARAVLFPDYPGRWEKAGLYINPWDPEWVTGDRNGVASGGIMPPSIRELLRASAVDYGLSRVPGLEWQDGVADLIADAIVQSDDVNAHIDGIIDEGINAGQKVAKGSGREALLHIRWAVQDGVARGVIRCRRDGMIFSPIEPPPSKKAAAKTPPPPPTPS